MSTLLFYSIILDPNAKQWTDVAYARETGHDITVHIGSDISTATMDRVRTAVNKVKATDNPKATLRVTIDTNGGRVWPASIINGLLYDLKKTHPVVIVVTGMCASAGMLILASVPTSHRHATKQARFMVHACRIDGERNSDTKAADQQAMRLMREGTRMSQQSVERVFRTGRDYWINSPRKALNLGFVGRIID